MEVFVNDEAERARANSAVPPRAAGIVGGTLPPAPHEGADAGHDTAAAEVQYAPSRAVEKAVAFTVRTIPPDEYPPAPREETVEAAYPGGKLPYQQRRGEGEWRGPLVPEYVVREAASQPREQYSWRGYVYQSFPGSTPPRAHRYLAAFAREFLGRLLSFDASPVEVVRGTFAALNEPARTQRWFRYEDATPEVQALAAPGRPIHSYLTLLSARLSAGADRPDRLNPEQLCGWKYDRVPSAPHWMVRVRENRDGSWRVEAADTTFGEQNIHKARVILAVVTPGIR